MTVETPAAPSPAAAESGDAAAKPQKLEGYELLRAMGSPRNVVAPMVDQSELAWRLLSRRYNSHLAYTPMFNAKLFANPKNEYYRREMFNVEMGEEGGKVDRPLVVQFAANEPDVLLAAAKLVEKHCDAVDLNLGCPQHIARRGHYGSFLQDDWDLVFSLINTLHKNLSIPVTAKFRVFPTVERSVEYAQMLERAGAQILTCHGRTREMKGHNTGLADWDKIKAIKQAVKVPVFANGNVLYPEDVQRCLDYTGCDGVMSAEGNLYNPAIFASQYPPCADLAAEYLGIVRSLKTETGNSAIKSHLFKLFKPALGKYPEFRERLGTCSGLEAWERLVEEFKVILEKDAKEAGVDLSGGEPQPIPPLENGYRTLPHWLAQPYFRPLAPPSSATPSISADLASAEQADAVVALADDPSHPPLKRPLSPSASLTDPKRHQPTPTVCAGASCQSLAAARCARHACLNCCRRMGVEAEGGVWDGTGEGKGCEGHETKERVRKERATERRKVRKEKGQGKMWKGGDGGAGAVEEDAKTAAVEPAA